MARSTLNTRLTDLATNVFAALGSDHKPTVDSGKYVRRGWMTQTVDAKSKHISINYSPSRNKDNLDLIASVIVAVARTQGLRAGWRIDHRDFDACTLVISFKLDYGHKSSTAATDLPTDYTPIKGFTANTHSDLQLFGGNGLSSEDAQRLTALLG